MIRIGTRDSKLAIWQAEQVQQQLAAHGFSSELVFIKSEGDIDLHTPLYAMGVQGVFTRSLDIALLSNRIDIAVHSMKDVPTQLPKGIVQCAVLPRGPVKDLLVYKSSNDFLQDEHFAGAIATSSIRRKAQWLNKYPNYLIYNLRGNVITRLRKLEEAPWNGAIFAQAGLERINMRPQNSMELDWMLPAPAQGAVMVVCREADDIAFEACQHFNDTITEICTKIERDFLRTLLGGCSTPISAYAELQDQHIHFRGNIFSLDGKEKVEIEQLVPVADAPEFGMVAANALLQNGGKAIADAIRNPQA